MIYLFHEDINIQISSSNVIKLAFVYIIPCTHHEARLAGCKHRSDTLMPNYSMHMEHDQKIGETRQLTQKHF